MLDSNGFKKMEYADILDSMQSKAQELFGEDVNTSASTPLGVILRIFAWFIAICWDTAEQVYNSSFIKKANGVQLDYLGGNQGMTREPASNSYVALSFTGTAGFVISIGTQFSTVSGINFMMIEDVTLDASGNGTGQAVSASTGASNNVGANTITEQAEPVEEITTVTNPQASAGGMDEEDDYSYQSRLISANEGSGKATTNAILTALLGTTAVRSASVVFNRTMQTDAEGNPPKSVHAYVLGGTVQDVAQSLFDSVSAGTETVGSQSVDVTDLSGNPHTIKFDYATPVQIYVKAVLTTNSAFPADGVKQVQDFITGYIGGVNSNGAENNGLGMHQDVRLSKLFSTVYQVTGIDDVSLTIGIDTASLSASNVTIGPQQVAQTEVSQIEVDVNA